MHKLTISASLALGTPEHLLPPGRPGTQSERRPRLRRAGPGLWWSRLLWRLGSPRWVADHLSSGLWLNGRVWLWQQRMIALARLPLGWRSRPVEPYQRQPSRHLAELLFLCVFLLGLWLAIQTSL